MARRHKYAGASVSITTNLGAERIAELCEQAAKRSESLQVMIRLEESKPGRLVYSARNRVMAGRVEFMTFEVVLKPAADRREVRTRLLSYKVKRQWILIIPMPWQMLAWRNYKDFMYHLQAAVRAADAAAVTSVVELAHQGA
jgi:hypothetical protein